MSAVATVAARPAVAARDAAILQRIADEGTELAIWQRPRPAALFWLDDVDWDAIEDLDFDVPVARLDAEIAAGLVEAGFPSDHRGAAMSGDVAALARHLAAVTDCAAVRIRLEVIDADACRRFHSDRVVARLLTTFVGPATQWIETRSPERIHRLEGGDVAIFKGRLSVETPAILHRSPPIAGTGDVRLLLAIDPADDRHAGGIADDEAAPPRSSAPPPRDDGPNDDA